MNKCRTSCRSLKFNAPKCGFIRSTRIYITLWWMYKLGFVLGFHNVKAVHYQFQNHLTDFFHLSGDVVVMNELTL